MGWGWTTTPVPKPAPPPPQWKNGVSKRLSQRIQEGLESQLQPEEGGHTEGHQDVIKAMRTKHESALEATKNQLLGEMRVLNKCMCELEYG